MYLIQYKHGLYAYALTCSETELSNKLLTLDRQGYTITKVKKVEA